MSFGKALRETLGCNDIQCKKRCKCIRKELVTFFDIYVAKNIKNCITVEWGVRKIEKSVLNIAWTWHGFKPKITRNTRCNFIIRFANLTFSRIYS